MKVFLPNLAFEDELSGRGKRMTPAARRAAEDLSVLIGLLGEPGDLALPPVIPLRQSLPECLQHVTFEPVAHWIPSEDQNLIPWGWSPQARAFAFQTGQPKAQIPSAEAVATTNSRLFSAAFDHVEFESAVALPFDNPSHAERRFGKMVYDMASLESAVHHTVRAGYSCWVAKPQISHAGRNRLRCAGMEVNRQQQDWLNARLPAGLYVEPWVERLDEASLQFDIVTTGSSPTVTLVGVTGLRNDSRGQYTGSIIRRSDECEQSEWDAAIRHGMKVCQAAADVGYSGPVGIDAFRFQTSDGSVGTRLCNDVNARFTMGRLALSLRHYLSDCETGLWMLAAGQQFSTFLERMWKTLGQSAFRDVRAMVSSPENLCNRPVFCGSVLLIGPNTQTVKRVADELG